MREIKFRAWDKTGIQGMMNWEKILKVGFELYLTVSFGAILMQYTGLKDKNGKEIYEGDILEGGEPIDNEPRRGIIKWVNTPYTAHFDFGILPSNIYCEIIGNIYENPELLTREGIDELN